MSELIFIRHGQASFGKGDYDILSEQGRQQSLLVAQYLLKTGLSFTRAYSGTLNRQIGTAETVLDYMKANAIDTSSLKKLKELNEYQFEEIMRHYFPLLAAQDTSLHSHIENVYTDKRSFQLLFDRAINRWITDDPAPDEIEGWNKFKERVEDAIKQITAENDKNSKILLFSSGGVISTAVHIATGMSPYESIRMGWGLANTSITKFRFGRSGLILHSFNSYPHLESYQSGELITYR